MNSDRLSLTDSGMDVMVKMSQGNPGALSVLAKLMQGPAGLRQVLDLDDMGIRGSSIWIGYKDWAGQDIEKFKKALRDRDPAMVAKINASGGKAWTGGKS